MKQVHNPHEMIVGELYKIIEKGESGYTLYFLNSVDSINVSHYNPKECFGMFLGLQVYNNHSFMKFFVANPSIGICYTFSNIHDVFSL